MRIYPAIEPHTVQSVLVVHLLSLIHIWTSEEKKKKIQELLASKGIDLEAMKADQHMSDVDDFDFICHVAFEMCIRDSYCAYPRIIHEADKYGEVHLPSIRF